MNKPQRNYRRIGAYTLMILSAFSMVAQYSLQGILASGHPTADLPPLFWQADWALWAMRALIEAVVILYLFETSAEHDRDRRLLYVFEASLIVLITATIAPALRAQGLHQTMPESVSDEIFTFWCIGLAMYTPLMMGGLATALRVQPGQEQTIPAAQHQALQTQLETIREQAAEMRLDAQANTAELEQLRQANAAHERRLEILRAPETTRTATAMAQALLTHVYTNGNRPATKVMAGMLNVSDQTIRKASADVQERMPGINGEQERF